MNPKVRSRLASLELVAFDVDGVFTDGRFYLSDDGVETKAFHTQDGYGIRRLLDAGIEVAVISGRRSLAVAARMKELNVAHVFLGQRDKVKVFRSLLETLKISAERSAFVGDDLPDAPVLAAAGFAIAVANAHPDLLDDCDWTTARTGGHGAVREVCDAILQARENAATSEPSP